MRNIRILLLCSSRFALQTMQELAFFNQLAAIAIPAHCDEWQEHTAGALQGMNVPMIILQKATFAKQLQDAFHEYSANMGLMVTFSYKIPKSVYSIPEKGFFNVHPGPLPAYRGSDPVFHQITNREKYAAVTIHQLDAGWDSGPVVMREMLPISSTDTYGLLSYKLSMLASRLVNNLVKLVDFELTLPLKPQDEAKAVYHRKQTVKEVSILWEKMDARSIIALVNACNPWNKGASTRLGQKIFRFVEAAMGDVSTTAEAGTILSFQGSEMFVACIKNETIAVSIVSTDEGIMNAGRLSCLDVTAWQKFETIA